MSRNPFGRYAHTWSVAARGDRNAGESHQYQLLRHETTALYGGNIVTVQGVQCTGVLVCP